MPKLISDLAIMLLTAGVVAVLFKRFRLPLVLGYILAGFLVGPYMPWFFTVADQSSIETWSEIGIIVLMFGLGLEFNLHKLVSVGTTAVITALTEVLGLQRHKLPILQPDVNMTIQSGDLVWVLGTRRMAEKLLAGGFEAE